MRFSLLALFGVMTAVALLLGMPGYVFLFAGLFVLSSLALSAFVWLAESTIGSAVDFLQIFASRRRLEDIDNPPFGIEPPARVKPQAENHDHRQTTSES